MAVLKFRIYFEEDDTIYRDLAIKHAQRFSDLHNAILKAYDFDDKHQATFNRSNDNWDRGKEITLEKYDKAYKAEPLLMHATTIASEIKTPSQKFIYTYDFKKNWTFLVELIGVYEDESKTETYPQTIRKEGIAPPQYGTKSLLGEKLADIEEKYDLANLDGFGEEGDDDGITSDKEETFTSDEDEI
jgi:Plasmid pRiA4b ORF-3-like protein